MLYFILPQTHRSFPSSSSSPALAFASFSVILGKKRQSTVYDILPLHLGVCVCVSACWVCVCVCLCVIVPNPLLNGALTRLYQAALLLSSLRGCGFVSCERELFFVFVTYGHRERERERDREGEGERGKVFRAFHQLTIAVRGVGGEERKVKGGQR